MMIEVLAVIGQGWKRTIPPWTIAVLVGKCGMAGVAGMRRMRDRLDEVIAIGFWKIALVVSLATMNKTHLMGIVGGVRGGTSLGRIFAVFQSGRLRQITHRAEVEGEIAAIEVG
jgi:hypothetical protein